MTNYLGIDIGGSFIKYGVITDKGEVLSYDKLTTARTEPQVLINQLADLIYQAKKANAIQGVGISLPGVIKGEGQLVTSGAIEGLYEYDVIKILSEKTGLRVKLTNDANAIAFAEKWLGAGKECDHFVCIPIGTGVGGAIVINGQVIKGRTGAAGEFGMSLMGLGTLDPVRYESVSFYCGAVAGLCRIYNTKHGVKDFTNWEKDIQVILLRAEAGEKEAIESLDAFYHNVAVLLLNIVVTLDPEKILIGGGISENHHMMSGIKSACQTLAKRYSDVTSLGLPNIISCQLGNQAGMIGAIVPFLEQ